MSPPKSISKKAKNLENSFNMPIEREFLLPFAAGNFIYIAGSDLIPELHKETKPVRSILELLAFVFGILVMLALLVLE